MNFMTRVEQAFTKLLSADFHAKCAFVSLLDRGVHRIENPSANWIEDVHFVRTTIKQLRAMLRLIQPAIPAESFQREDLSLKNAARRLARMRDTAVGARTLERLTKTARSKGAQEACKIVLDHYQSLATARSPAQEKKTTHAVARMLRRSGRSIQRLPIVQDEWRIIGPGLAQVYRSGRRRMSRALTRGDDASFHRWRIRVKNLYFQLQWLTPFWPRHLRRMTATLEQLQKALGADHDLTVLKTVLEKRPGDFGGPPVVTSVLACLEERSRTLRRASRRLGEKLFAEKPRHFIQRFKQHWRKSRASSDAG